MMFMLLMILICITFLTLLEQKVLSYIQIRKGPNVVGMLGIIQPFSDALKLFLKEVIYPIFSNYLVYFFSPIMSFSLSLILWLLFPYNFYCFSFNFMFLLMFSIMSVGVYFIMISGWSSNSNYALLGSLRSIAQTISYEVCMIIIFLCFIIFVMSFNIIIIMNYQINLSMIFLNFILSFIMFVIFLAETNRAPFDFAEGESELISGFNIEYSSGGFALIFLAEYSMILFLSLLFCVLFLFNSLFYFMFYFKFMMISYLFIWVRSTYPRYRYDKLMNLTWKFYLMISLFLMMIFIIIKMMFMMF
uniref:NADH-ubiquinone oxidoreductase chain 1 n=1 Tax=Neomikiella lychnidis TaxID=2719079 RepID=A0A7L7S7B6_9DIPT|nr:NADH dehydrogenase subunit 1 [Neomikiella lychnidis]